MPQADKPATTPSLPGAMSTRTDGGIASKQAQRYIAGMPNYGDGQELSDIQASAPMAATSAPKATTAQGVTQGSLTQSASQMQQQPQQATSLFAPTQFPGEPVTHGGALGPGAGPEVLGLPGAAQTGNSARQTVQALASNPDASPELVQLAKLLGQ